MSELADVAGGETITAAFTNQVKERSSMRYASQAALDTSVPAPVEGTVAYLQDTNILQYYNGTAWTPLLVVATASGDFLLLDASNGPVTGSLDVQGNVSSTKTGAAVLLRAADLANGWNMIADVSDGTPGPWQLAEAGQSATIEVNTTGDVQLLKPVTTGLRNVHASTVGPSGGIDGDIWLQYT